MMKGIARGAISRCYQPPFSMARLGSAIDRAGQRQGEATLHGVGHNGCLATLPPTTGYERF